MNLLLSLLAAISYTVGGVFMRKAEGFAHALPAGMVFVCFCTGAALQTLAMKRSEVSVNYILVLGLEAALALLLGVAWLGESMSPLKAGGVALILAGVASLRLAESGEPRSPSTPLAHGRTVTLRAARPADLGALLALINGYAERGLLLERSPASLRAGLADFVVAVVRTTPGEEIVGCGALVALSSRLGEVRSLAVRADAVGRGLGHSLATHLLEEASGRGLAEVLALTRRPSFFAALGFVPTEREEFPEKIRADCRSCRRARCCAEVAMVRAVADRVESGPCGAFSPPWAAVLGRPRLAACRVT